MDQRAEFEHRIFDMLMASQFWPAERLRDYQRQQLGQLLRHARTNTPFYATRLEPLFRADGEIDWERWSDIPILSRADLTAHGEALLAKTVPAGHGGTGALSTSGTSGAPITVHWTVMGQVALHANRFRAYRWHGIDWTRTCCSVTGDDPASGAWPDGETLAPWGPRWDPASRRGRMLRINRLEAPEHTLDFLTRRGVSYLTGGPSTVASLALEAARLGVDLHLDGYLPHGAMVSDAARADVLRVFGARTVELYSSKEAGNIAHGCPAGEGLHVNAESVLVEIVDAAGKPVAEGQPGRVVVTPFLSAAQPLIRYDQGDIAHWLGPCTCGRHLPLLSGLIGRTTTIFRHPDGRTRSSYLGMHRKLLKCSAWQVAQTGPTDFEVRYVPLDPNVAGDEAALAAIIRRSYFEDAEVVFRRVTEIAPLPNGKPLEYVNEWAPRPEDGR